MYLSTMADWLNWIATVHLEEMDLGLDRIKQVAARLSLQAAPCPVVIVGGTNGKGSTVAGLEAIYREQGYRVGAFTSPYLFVPNEQVRLNGEMASDALICAAFAAINENRGDVTLTPFEFFTLAALYIFKQHPLDVWLLEVGLGGRLDAVNILDADVAVITSIGIDHTEWLGETREAIAAEKAGICRLGRPTVCGDIDPPKTLMEAADPFYCQGRHFHYHLGETHWMWESALGICYDNLPYPALAVQNISTVLMTITLLADRLPVNLNAIQAALATVRLPGRIQVVPGEVTRIYDVSHNPAAIQFLLAKLAQTPFRGKTLAIFSMLKDKDILTSIETIKSNIDAWYVAPLSVKRGASLATLQEAFKQAGVSEVHYFEHVTAADKQATLDAQAGDRLLIFGSFHTVAESLSAERRQELF